MNIIEIFIDFSDFSNITVVFFKEVIIHNKREDVYLKVEKIKRLIEEIAPYYSPEAINKFKENLKFIQRAEITQKKNAIRNNALSFEATIVNNYDPSIQLADTRGILKEKLKTLIEEKTKGFKFNVTLKVRLRKEREDGTIYKEPYFSSSTVTITNKDEILEKIELAEEEILKRIAVWISEGSGWVIDEILNHYINVVSYIPLRGNSYIPLPKELRNSKKGLINLKNEDNKCFLWCHIRHKNPVKIHRERVKMSDKEFVQKLDYSGITFPVQIKDVGKIEKQNSINISIFGYENEKLYPIRTSEEKYNDHMDLLFITEGENEKTKSHFVLIQNFDRLMYNFTKHKDTKHFCKRCLHCFSSKNLLERHKGDCFLINGTQAITMPAEGSKIYFKNRHKMQPVPFVIYADFEAITEKIDTCQPSNQKSYTTTYQSHRACGFGYKGLVVCHYDQSYSKPVEIYRGGKEEGKEDVIERFIQKMFEEVRSCQSVMRENFNKPLKMTLENERDFQNSTSCYICGRKYKVGDGDENRPVRDHCHITGKYRGSAHNDCNLKLRIEPESIKIPVIFHNLKGYDSHFIIQKIGKIIEEEIVYDVVRVKKDSEKNDSADNQTEVKRKIDINIIANNFEKYMSFRLGKHLHFIDSFQFMSQSLDKLSSNLPEDRFIYTGREIDGDLDLMKKKGVYPYDYMDSFSRFNGNQLPKREEFYSILNDTDISEDDYKHAQKVWNAFKIRNLGEYHDLYLKTDVLLLADVFENFRETCLHHHRLDPSHYMTSPGLSWDAMLKMTKINLVTLICSCLLKKDCVEESLISLIVMEKPIIST